MADVGIHFPITASGGSSAAAEVTRISPAIRSVEADLDALRLKQRQMAEEMSKTTAITDEQAIAFRKLDAQIDLLAQKKQRLADAEARNAGPEGGGGLGIPGAIGVGAGVGMAAFALIKQYGDAVYEAEVALNKLHAAGNATFSALASAARVGPLDAMDNIHGAIAKIQTQISELNNQNLFAGWANDFKEAFGISGDTQRLEELKKQGVALSAVMKQAAEDTLQDMAAVRNAHELQLAGKKEEAELAERMAGYEKERRAFAEKAALAPDSLTRNFLVNALEAEFVLREKIIEQQKKETAWEREQARLRGLALEQQKEEIESQKIEDRQIASGAKAMEDQERMREAFDEKWQRDDKQRKREEEQAEKKAASDKKREDERNARVLKAGEEMTAQRKEQERAQERSDILGGWGGISARRNQERIEASLQRAITQRQKMREANAAANERGSGLDAFNAETARRRATTGDLGPLPVTTPQGNIGPSMQPAVASAQSVQAAATKAGSDISGALNGAAAALGNVGDSISSIWAAIKALNARMDSSDSE